MYGMDVVVLALDEQRVRLLVLLSVCVCLCLNLKCLLESANYWRSIQYEVVCSLIIMRYFAVQINDTLQWR